MKKVTLAVVAATCVLLTLSSLAWFDRPLAEFVHTSGVENAWLAVQGTALLDWISGKNVSKFLLPFLLLVSGGLMAVRQPWRKAGLAMLFVGLVQGFGTLLAGMSKVWFGRLRPWEIMQHHAWSAEWFRGGNSFPSGHVAFYLGLFLPLACLFPRWRWPLLAVPAFVALARIDANDHFLGDVLASVALIATVTLIAISIFGRALRPVMERANTSVHRGRSIRQDGASGMD